MLDIILEILEYAFIVIGLGAVIGLIIDTVIAIVNSLKETRWVRLVPYTILVREIILFTNDILVDKKIRNFPSFKIRYYRNKKYAGLFNGEVIVYLGNNPDIQELTDTVLHEVQHYVQSQTDRHYKYYDQYTAERGYWDNPFEVECRKFASQHRDACLRYLETKRLIKRA